MEKISRPYQLPSFYKNEKEECKRRRCIFVFLAANESVIQAVAAEVASSIEHNCLLQLLFESGISEADLQRYIAIFDSALPAERGVEIESELNIPTSDIRQRYRYSCVVAVRRRALLN